MIFSGAVVTEVIIETALTLFRSKKATGGTTAGSEACRG
jgi:hypothetical protein